MGTKKNDKSRKSDKKRKPSSGQSSRRAWNRELKMLIRKCHRAGGKTKISEGMWQRMCWLAMQLGLDRIQVGPRRCYRNIAPIELETKVHLSPRQGHNVIVKTLVRIQVGERINIGTESRPVFRTVTKSWTGRKGEFLAQTY